VHAILETALGMTNVEEIATASPRMQGISLGPADLAASRRMKTTRVGGGHPGYRTIADPDPANADAPRASFQQDPWHYTVARMVDACAAPASSRSTARTGTSRTSRAARPSSVRPSCSAASDLDAASGQIDIAKRVFSPDPEEVRFARKVIEAIPDGRGVHMIDGKMQDDATWKQCRVMVDLADMLARRDPELAAAYGV
jgi:malyl-CoA/(S)-citramalyl-CoA lyase